MHTVRYLRIKTHILPRHTTTFLPVAVRTAINRAIFNGTSLLYYDIYKNQILQTVDSHSCISNEVSNHTFCIARDSSTVAVSSTDGGGTAK